MDNIPSSLGSPVVSTTKSWEQMVIRAWGSEYRKPDVAYEFSNGRKFDSTDMYETGVYRRG
jgi:hypothetical protein